MTEFNERISLTDAPYYVAQPITDAVYAELMTGNSADLMLESATIDEVDHAYLGNEMLYTGYSAMFEAVTSERMRLSQTMRAFVRALNRGMNGTGIKAGTDDAGVDEEGRNTIGGAIIGKVRRVNNIPIMTALIPLSDGQSISLIFHSPTADKGKIKNNDLLVAFRFLLNKRDVTHIVAPIGGRDVSLQQVSQALANLTERNSAKFIKQQSAQVKLRADIEGLNAEADQLGEQQSALLEQVETHQQALMSSQTDAQQLRNKLASQRQINADLEAQLAALKANAGSEKITLPGETGRTFTDTTRKVKEGLSMSGIATLSNGAEVAYKTADDNGDLVGWVQITDPSGQVYKMPSPSSQGAKMGETATKLLKAYRENKADKFVVAAQEDNVPLTEPAPTPPPADPAPGSDDNQRTGKYRYALVNRPAGPATIPDGNVDILPPVSQDEPYGRIARHGFVTYDTPLTDADMASFELKLIPTHADLDALAVSIAQGSMNSYAKEYLEMAEEDADTFRSQVSIFARKDAPNVAFPQGDDLAYFLQAMKGALAEAAKTPPEKDTGTGEGGGEEIVKEEVSEADQAANDALAYLQSILSLQSKDMSVIRDARTKVRGAIGALQAAGRDVENEPLVNDAAQHLSDLLVAIQREGATA
ncbi:head protein [Leclercia adecarboxylata]|uniref:antirestriction phage head protein DarA n=1 Tax=Leclercia adecarboxylata TaxID=83655 RepID=UPI00111A4BC0|nr:head protein [Leclercia adecarboxylata]QCZ30155.1 head protein [Leclercia adecarboxylata]